MKKVLLICFFILSACSTNPYALSKDGKKVKVSMTKPKKCEVVGRVFGENDLGEVNSAINIARNEAAKKDGDTIYVNDEVQNGSHIKVIATAYKCK